MEEKEKEKYIDETTKDTVKQWTDADCNLPIFGLWPKNAISSLCIFYLILLLLFTHTQNVITENHVQVVTILFFCFRNEIAGDDVRGRENQERTHAKHITLHHCKHKAKRWILRRSILEKLCKVYQQNLNEYQVANEPRQIFWLNINFDAKSLFKVWSKDEQVNRVDLHN